MFVDFFFFYRSVLSYLIGKILKVNKFTVIRKIIKYIIRGLESLRDFEELLEERKEIGEIEG